MTDVPGLKNRLSRRQASVQALAVSSLVACAGWFPGRALALGKQAFDAKSLQEALDALQTGALVESSEVSIAVPERAENGALVPCSISATLPGVSRLLILVEKNPVALVAIFHVTGRVKPAFSTRIKMAQSGDVYGVALMADGRALYARKAVQVTVGSCDV
ncbi:MAG: thiosulfate-binding protein SoxY [Polaromonas sp.]|nr:thiosulfate-binding protein SoxY [Polaromonas sp.]